MRVWLIVLMVWFWPVMAKAQAVHQPKLCTGYNPETGDWGWSNMRRAMESFCPKQQAVFELDDAGQSAVGTKRLAFEANCCPLPADDVLGTEETLAAEFCPRDYVVTGRVVTKRHIRGVEADLHCTKINTSRYQLGEPAPGLYWGYGSGMTFLNESRGVRRSDLPQGLRHAAGRENRTSWDIDGCVGNPPGSIFVGRTSRRCSGLYFSQLQYRGNPGDPSAGTPVVMFPECSEVVDILSADAHCSAGGS